MRTQQDFVVTVIFLVSVNILWALMALISGATPADEDVHETRTPETTTSPAWHVLSVPTSASEGRRAESGSNMGVNEINSGSLSQIRPDCYVKCRPHEPYNRCLFSKEPSNEPNFDVNQKVWKDPKMVGCLSNSTHFFSPDLVDCLLVYWDWTLSFTDFTTVWSHTAH